MQDTRSEVEKQSERYILKPKHGGYTYSFDERREYIRDYVISGILTAEEFIKRAINENHVEVTHTLELIKEGITSGKISTREMQYRIREIERLIENRPENKEVKDIIENLESAKMQLEYHYIGDESDPDRIIFNINDTSRYVKDWLKGIGNAKDYVDQAIREDYTKLLPVIAQSNPKDADLLIDLLLEHLNRIDDENAIMIILGLNAIREIMKAEDPQAIAVSLESAASSVGLDSVLENKLIANIFSSQLLKRNALPYINSTTVLLDVCRRLGQQNYDAIAKQIFDACLNDNFNKKHVDFIDVLKFLKKDNEQQETGPVVKVLREAPAMKDVSLWEPKEERDLTGIITAEMGGMQRVKVGQRIKIKLEEPIHFDFYVNFATNNFKALADLAFEKNPSLFKELLTQALAVLSNDRAMLAIKWKFLQNLFAELTNFYFYDECFVALDNALKKTGLTPITRPHASPKASDGELLAETRRELEETEEFYIPNGQTSVYGSLMSSIFGSTSSVSPTKHKPETEKEKDKEKEVQIGDYKAVVTEAEAPVTVMPFQRGGEVELQVRRSNGETMEQTSVKSTGFINPLAFLPTINLNPLGFWSRKETTVTVTVDNNQGKEKEREKEKENDVTSSIG